MTDHPCGCRLNRSLLRDHLCAIHAVTGFRSTTTTGPIPKEPMNTTPTVKQMLLALAVGFAVTGAVLLLWDRNSAAGTEPPGCGPQQLTVSEGTVTVDPEGCAVDLAVFSIPEHAHEYCNDTVCMWIPQTLVQLETGSGPLSVDLPCGRWQVDVLDGGTYNSLPPNALELINRNPDAFMQWLTEHPEMYGIVTGTEIGTRVCTHVPAPAAPPVDVGVKPLVIERPDPAVPVVAQPKVAG